MSVFADIVPDQICGSSLRGSLQEPASSARASLVLLLAAVGVVSLAGCATTGSKPQAQDVQLVASPSALSFGSISLGSASTQMVTLTNSGNANVTVSQASISGTGFSLSGLTPPVTLIPDQSYTCTVQFAPQTPGNFAGSLSLLSNAPSSPATVALSGSGVQFHFSVLNWDPSTSVVVGYNVYRGAESGGPYMKQNLSPASATNYTDNNVLAGQTYFYVVTAVDSNNDESIYSNEVSVNIPSP